MTRVVLISIVHLLGPTLDLLDSVATLSNSDILLLPMQAQIARAYHGDVIPL